MAREKFQTLTEQMFYVLLCLREECCGMDLMERIRLLTSGDVYKRQRTTFAVEKRTTSFGSFSWFPAE